MPHYASLNALASDIPMKTIVAMLDDDKDGAADPDILEDVLQKVDDEINSYLAARFALPLAAPLPAVVSKAARSLLGEALYKRRGLANPKNSFVIAASAARAQLQEIKDGTGTLDIATPPARPAGGVILERARTVSRGFSLFFLMAAISTLALMGALKTRLEAMTIADDNDAKAFSEVRFSAKKNFLQAVSDLQVANTDVCLIHPVGDTFENARIGAALQTERFTEFMLLIGTEDFSAETGEMLDRPDGPSILTLKDRVLEKFTADNLGFTGPERVSLEPLAGAVMQLSYEENGAELAGRQVWQQVFRTRCGVTRK